MAVFPKVSETKRRKDRARVGRLIGRSLKTTEEVHHHTDGVLVACEDDSYHKLLHQRTRALRACGHADWRRCNYCKKYDSPDNLDVYKKSACHPSCSKEHKKKWLQSPVKIY